MADCIDREAAVDAIWKVRITPGGELFNAIKRAQEELIKQLPTVQPERKKGKWRRWTWEKCVDFETEKHKSVRGYTCSECQRGTAVATKFCPNCGADMREES